ALRLAAEHHEGQEEADRTNHARGARRRRPPAAQDPQDRGAAETPGRKEARLGRGAGRQAPQRGAGDLMSILVLAEHDNSALKPATLHTVAAAQAIGGEIDILVAGQGCGAVAQAASKIAGVNKVLVADDAAYAHPVAEDLAKLIVPLAKSHSHL